MWSIGGTTLTGESRSARSTTRSSATFSTADLPQTALGSDPGPLPGSTGLRIGTTPLLVIRITQLIKTTAYLIAAFCSVFQDGVPRYAVVTCLQARTNQVSVLKEVFTPQHEGKCYLKLH